MSRRTTERLDDILEAIGAIRSHRARGDLDDDLVYDAVRARLIEIGEAVKGIPADLRAEEPGIPWRDVAAMRDRLAHAYFDISHEVVAATLAHDLPELEAAVRRLADRPSGKT